MRARLPAVTLREVARAAGVSTASASRALAAEGVVSADLRRRILAAAERLGYVPNLAARSLAGRRSGLVGVLVHGLAEPLIADAVTALERRLAEAGYGVLIAVAGASAGQSVAALRALLSRGAEALVLADPLHRTELAEAMRTRAVPWVAIADDVGEGERAVDWGRRRGAALASRYLLDLGHRHIAVIAPFRAGTATGVDEALAGSNLPPLGEGFQPAADVGAAQTAMRLFLSAADIPTAVICGSDLQALAAVRECVRHGLAVPSAISIIGFGDAEFARRASPALTTLRIPGASLGVRVAETLLLGFDHGGPPPAFEMPVKLVVRESTGQAPR